MSLDPTPLCPRMGRVPCASDCCATPLCAAATSHGSSTKMNGIAQAVTTVVGGASCPQ
jgi:hypothetical protein